MNVPDENYKRSIKNSFQRQIKKMRSREEQRLLDENSKRRGSNKRSGPRRRTWEQEEDEDQASFETMRPAAQLDLEQAKQAAGVRQSGGPQEVNETVRDVIVSVARDRVWVSDGGDSRVAWLDGNSPQAAVGDRALTEQRSDGEESLLAIAPRRTVLSRPDPGNPRRELVLAANVDVAVIVASVGRPAFRPGLVDRFLVTTQRGGITPVLVVNKMDLLSGEGAQALEKALQPFEQLGLEIFRVSAENGQGLTELRERLAGLTCVLAGHSGVGKSTILNAVDRQRLRDTGQGRGFDGKGRHTTTSSELTFLGDGTRLIDTPGIRTLGLWKIAPEELAGYFPEFEHAIGQCRFRDCAHVVEPDCGVQAAVDRGEIPRSRYAVYVRFHGELSG